MTYTNPETAARIDWLDARVAAALEAYLTAPSEEVAEALANHDWLINRRTEVCNGAIDAGEYKPSS